VEWSPGHVPTAYFYDSENNLVSETQLGNKNHKELLQLFEEYNFKPQLKQAKYSSTPNSKATFEGHTYELYNTKNLYAIAERFATTKINQNETGYILTITSEQENEFVRKFLEPTVVESVWLGAHDLDTEGEWKWNQELGSPEANKIFFRKPKLATSEHETTEIQLSSNDEMFSNWSPNEPNDADADEDCAIFSVKEGSWNDVRCGFVDADLVVEFGSTELKTSNKKKAS